VSLQTIGFVANQQSAISHQQSARSKKQSARSMKHFNPGVHSTYPSRQVTAAHFGLYDFLGLYGFTLSLVCKSGTAAHQTKLSSSSWQCK